jgi:hypothetical protein
MGMGWLSIELDGTIGLSFLFDTMYIMLSY